MMDYLFLLLFIALWNLLLKVYVLGGLGKISGDKIKVQNLTIRDCYNIRKSHQNFITNVIIDSIVGPIIFYYVFVLFIWIVV